MTTTSITVENTCSPSEQELQTQLTHLLSFRNSANFNGNLTFNFLPYDPDTVDDPSTNQTLNFGESSNTKAKEKGLKSISSCSQVAEDDVSNFKQITSDLETKRRSFVVYEPKGFTLGASTAKLPIVVLLHGTDETCLNTELVIQEDKACSWLSLADEKQFLVVVPQARGARETMYGSLYPKTGMKQLHWVWQPGIKDFIFLHQVLQHMETKYAGHIEPSKVFAIGFSNGGLWTSDLILNFLNNNEVAIELKNYYEKTGKKPSSLTFTALCNFMGGIPSLHLKEQHEGKQFVTENHVPLYLITGTKDVNRMSCYYCYQFFSKRKYPLHFEVLEGKKHEYLSTKTRQIFDFFMDPASLITNNNDDTEGITKKLYNLLT